MKHKLYRKLVFDSTSLQVNSGAIFQTQGSKPGVPMRIKLDISVEAPEITMPLNSKSCDVVVLDLGQFSLTNGFLGLDVGFSKDKSMALYEQHHMELKDLKLYR